MIVALKGAELSLPDGVLPEEFLMERFSVEGEDGNRINAYRRENGRLFVPRNADLSEMLPGLLVMRKSTSASLPGVRTTCITKPRSPEQIEALRLLSSTVGRDRVLVLGCGKGKTYISLAYACAHGRYPLLVVVPTTQLQTQWVESIRKHTNIAPEDIGLVGGSARVPEVGRLVTVGVLNSVSRPEFAAKYADYFDLVVFDEAHRLGAENLGRAARYFTGERLSLTATYERDDGREALYRDHLGELLLEDVSFSIDPEVWFLQSGILLDEKNYRWKGGALQTPKMVNSISKDKGREKQELALIRQCVADGRTVLVLGERVGKLERMRRLCSSFSDSGLLVGKQKGESKVEYASRSAEAMTTSQVVFATSKLAKEGLDREAFDTLIILNPFGGLGRLRQSLGRILRPKAGKKQPKAIIVYDASFYTQKSGARMPGYFTTLAAKMRNNVRALGYEPEEGCL